MKILRYDDWRTGILLEGGGAPRVLDVAMNLGAVRDHDPASAAMLEATLGHGDRSWNPMIESWDRAGPLFHALADRARADASSVSTRTLDSVRIGAALPSPHARIFALGGNVASHMAAAMKAITGNNVTPESILEEKRQGLQPWGFMILPETVVGTDAKVCPPAGIQKYDYESEVAVLLRSGGRGVAANAVAVWGYTAWNDLSIRDGRLGIGLPLHRGAFSWAIEKNFDTGNACGPWVVVDEPRDPMKLRVQMRVNGVTRQDWSTEEMMYTFGETASFISGYLRLAPGDIICSGTGHGTAAEYGRDGDRWLKAGDRLEVEVEGVGVLRNDVVAW